jgi:hypothetical protein
MISALATGGLGSDQAREARAHLVECPECRASLADVVALLANPDVAFQRRQLEPQRNLGSWGASWAASARVRRIVGAAAAAVLLLAVGLQVTRRVDTGYHLRDEAPVEPAPTSLSPTGEVTSPSEFHWSRSARAREFRVTLFDYEGTVLWEAQVNDTVATLPDSVRLQPATNYFWKVAARADYGRWISSGLRQFRIVGGRQ